MNIIFITRCYKPTNLQAIKDNLKEVFYNQSDHTYVHYLLVDMSYGEKEQAFKCFEDEHTKTYFIYEKKDYYNNSGIDQLLKKINEDQNDWVYVLDDDNFINKDILKAFVSYQNEDVILVNSNMIKISNPLVVGKIVGRSDVCNYIVKLKVRREVPTYTEGQKSFAADGKFLQNLVIKGYKFKYRTDLKVARYKALSRPLNVLRKDL